MSFSGTGKTSFQHNNVFCTTDLIKQTAVTQRTAVRRGINELILLLFAKSITTKRRILRNKYESGFWHSPALIYFEDTEDEARCSFHSGSRRTRVKKVWTREGLKVENQACRWRQQSQWLIPNCGCCTKANVLRHWSPAVVDNHSGGDP